MIKSEAIQPTSDPYAYVRKPGDAIRAVRWTGENWAEVHAVYPGLGEEYMRDKGCKVGDWVICPCSGRVYFMSEVEFQSVYERLEYVKPDCKYKDACGGGHSTAQHYLKVYSRSLSAVASIEIEKELGRVPMLEAELVAMKADMKLAKFAAEQWEPALLKYKELANQAATEVGEKLKEAKILLAQANKQWPDPGRDWTKRVEAILEEEV